MLFQRFSSFGKGHQFIINADGTRDKRLPVSGLGGLASATWSAEGDRVAYLFNGQPWVLTLATGEKERLLRDMRTYLSLDW